MVLTGILKRIIFEGRGSWSVASLEIDKELVTITGPMPGIHVGDKLEVSGEYVVDPKFGRQFKATSAIPIAKPGIESFLELLSNVGPIKSKLLREKFGDEIWNVIENEPDRLREISGLTAARISELREEYIQRKDDKELLVWCLGHGVTAYQVGLIRKHFKHQTLSVLKSDTYKITEVEGIGFITADRIALKLGVPPTSPARCRAAIHYALKEIEESDGSTLIEGGLLMACLKGQARGPGGIECPVQLSPPITSDLVYETLGKMRTNKELIFTDGCFQTMSTMAAEASVAMFLAERVTGCFRTRDDDGHVYTN